MHRRVVVTGVGLISPLSQTALGTFQGICSKELGVRAITASEFPDFSDVPVKIGGPLPSSLDLSSLLKQAGIVKNTYNALSIATCKSAFEDSKLLITDEESSRSVGIVYGSDKSSAFDLRKAAEKVAEGGYAKLDRFIIPKVLVSQGVGTAALALKIKGYANAITAGVATGQLAVSDAYRAIVLRYADAMVAGAAEVDFDPNIMMSLHKAGMLAKKEETGACRPFDVKAEGFVYSVGAGAMVLESLEHALARGANIYAEIVATASCAHTAMEPSNLGPLRVMQLAVNKAKIYTEQVSFVNADASGLKKWDMWEAEAIQNICRRARVTSHKGNLGHMLAASGICQNIITVMALQQQILPPIANLEAPVNENLNYVCNDSDKRENEYALTNSFTYDGGCFSSILYKKYSK